MLMQANIDKSFWRDDLDDREVMVSIKCLTYNHEPYIRQCLEGFVKQKTNFRFEAIVHDDASTDKTAEIVKEYAEKYPSIIKPIFEVENQYSKRDGTLTKIVNAHMRGKYVAMCEGDDYWTDPLKLQKQVDFMEANEEYAICCHRIKRYYEKENRFEEKKIGDFPSNESISFTNKENLDCWMTETSSVVYRSCMLDANYVSNYKYTRDTHLAYHLLKKGKGCCLGFYGSVYRWHEGGVYSVRTETNKFYMAYLIYRELRQNNPEDNDIQCFYLKYKNSFFNYLRQEVFVRDISKELLKAIRAFCYDSCRDDGLFAGLNCFGKLLKSFVKGFFKQRS